jgi:serine/threonine protein kinase
LLGAGGMGAVYKAEHQLMERMVALKVIKPQLVDSPIMAERFRREVKAAARLAHPNIVTAYDAEQAGSSHFLVMEFVEGTSLDKLVAEKGPLPVDQACDFIRQAALGLQHAFERGMIHRDIKPHNLMLTPAGQVKVLDFGLARFALENAPAATLPKAPTPTVVAAEKTSSGSLTETGMVMGTPDFLAPEQARDAHQADIRADIYSLGCTLYYLLAGHAPFAGETTLDKLLAHAEQTAVPLTNERPNIPPALAKVVERMMAKEPAQRFQKPVEVAQALAPFIPEPPASPQGKRRFLTIAAAVAVPSLLVGVAVYLWTGFSMSLGRSIRETVQAEGPAVESKGNGAPQKPAKARRLAQGEGVPAKYRATIDKGLAYLVGAQAADGHWEAAGGQYPVSITALAGMALMMEGSTDGDGKNAGAISKAVDWLIERGQPDGLLGGRKWPGGEQRYMFGHGNALLFLATVYAQEEDGERRARLEKILTKAVEFLSKAQTKDGGWGYATASEGDQFDDGASTIVQLQALRAARNAGLVVPKKLIDIDYLRKCTRPDGGVIYSITNKVEDAQKFAGNAGGGRPSLTAGALACMLTAGEYDSDLARKWAAFCRQTIVLDPLARGGWDEYSHYYYAQALYILGDQGYKNLFPALKTGESHNWSKYREAACDAILARQATDGSWTSSPLGTVYSTICFLTILQLDDGYLQIYRR